MAHRLRCDEIVDKAFVQLALVSGGYLSGSWFFSLILIPLLYGLPHLLSWSVRRYLEWRALLLYTLSPFFWICAFYIAVYQVQLLAGIEILVSTAFLIGTGLAALEKGITLLLCSSARQQIRTRLLNFATPYLTVTGAVLLRGLWTNMPQIGEGAPRLFVKRESEKPALPEPTT